MASRYETSTPIEKILVDLGVDLTSLAFEDSSEQDYLSKLREGLATIEFKAKGDYEKNPKFKEQYRVLQEEFLRVRKGGKKPQAKKTKISSDSFISTKKIQPKVTKISSQKLLSGSGGGALVPVPEGQEKEEEKKESVIKILSDISDSVKRIVEILVEGRRLDRKLSDAERKKQEAEARGAAENKLEKAFKTLKKIATGMLKPVAKPINALLNFIKNLILGKIVLGIFDWFSDPKNQEKVESITRFLEDHWPKLLALYLVFGNAFGRFVFRLTSTLISGAIKLGIAIAKLLAAKKVQGARGVARFLGGKKGRLLATGLTTAVTLGGTYALTQGMKGDDKTQKFSGGGYVRPRVPAFSGGGFLGNLFGGMGKGGGMMGGAKGAAMGALFGPLGMLIGSGLGSGTIQEGFGAAKDMIGGFVSGEKGVDKVPAMLSDGEFVMSRGAVKKYGVGTLESMNAAGGGTNKPKMVEGTTYAAGGGLIQDAVIKASARRPGDSEPSDAPFALKNELKKEKKSTSFNINPSVSVSNSVTRRLNDLSSTIDSSGTSTIPVSHPQTGSGFGLSGVFDYKGRPGVFSKGAAAAFGKMIADSKGKVKGTDIASSKRSKSYNRKVGGVANSNHLFGNALDIHGSSQTWMRANGPKYGWIINDYPGSHGGHFNYKGAGSTKMTQQDEGSPVAQSQNNSPVARSQTRLGSIRENTGIKIPGATDDRRFIPLNPMMMNMNFANGIAAQPGEYMLPSKTVTALGGPSIVDRIVAKTDSNSKAAKLGGSNVDINISPPSSEGRIKVIPLPPREEPDTSMVGGMDGSEVPNFSAGTGSRAKQKTLGVVR